MSAGRTRWGYHELRASSAQTLVRHCRIRPGELVLDIGAGTGALTLPLLATGATVIAVELHPRRAAQLRHRVADQRCRVLHTDALTFALPGRPFRIVANPPFGILAAMLRRVTAPSSRLVRADVVVPAYVAARWSRGAHPAIRRYDATTVWRLRVGDFCPPATQPIAVLSLRRR